MLDGMNGMVSGLHKVARKKLLWGKRSHATGTRTARNKRVLMESFCQPGRLMFQDAAWCLQSGNRGQVNCCQAAWAMKEQSELALRAGELSDFFWEFRKHQ